LTFFRIEISPKTINISNYYLIIIISTAIRLEHSQEMNR